MSEPICEQRQYVSMMIGLATSLIATDLNVGDSNKMITFSSHALEFKYAVEGKTNPSPMESISSLFC